ncbi:MAG: deoxyribonuclease, partial [Actinomycetes bacterium]
MRRTVVITLLLTLLSPSNTQAAPIDALAALNNLEVKGRAAKTGYARSQFPHWSDPDRNGCDARNDTLKRDLTDITYKVGT